MPRGDDFVVSTISADRFCENVSRIRCNLAANVVQRAAPGPRLINGSHAQAGPKVGRFAIALLLELRRVDAKVKITEK